MKWQVDEMTWHQDNQQGKCLKKIQNLLNLNFKLFLGK